MAHEYMDKYVKVERKRPEWVQARLDKDVLPFWTGRDARTIKAREVVILLDRIVERGSRVMANRVAAIVGRMFMYGVHRGLVEDSPVKLLYKPGGSEEPGERALEDRELKSFLLNIHSVCRTRRNAHALKVLVDSRSEL